MICLASHLWTFFSSTSSIFTGPILYILPTIESLAYFQQCPIDTKMSSWSSIVNFTTQHTSQRELSEISSHTTLFCSSTSAVFILSISVLKQVTRFYTPSTSFRSLSTVQLTSLTANKSRYWSSFICFWRSSCPFSRASNLVSICYCPFCSDRRLHGRRGVDNQDLLSRERGVVGVTNRRAAFLHALCSCSTLPWSSLRNKPSDM